MENQHHPIHNDTQISRNNKGIIRLSFNTLQIYDPFASQMHAILTHVTVMRRFYWMLVCPHFMLMRQCRTAEIEEKKVDCNAMIG